MQIKVEFLLKGGKRKTMNDIRLKSLCGEHFFSGCELTSEDVIDWYDEVVNCGVCLFTLDGVTYKAIEDPDDGYRSYCSSLVISEQKPQCSFPAVKVTCSMAEDDDYGRNEILVIRDAQNEKTILRVGTGNTDDYYPYCVFDYTPENMSCNEFINDILHF